MKNKECIVCRRSILFGSICKNCLEFAERAEDEMQAKDEELSRLRAALVAKDADIEKLRDIENQLKGSAHPAVIDDACMSVWHNFGALSEDKRETVRHSAKEWLKALGKAILAPALASHQPSKSETCVWLGSPSGYWATKCGKGMVSKDATPYCPFCGKRVEVRI